MGYCWAEALGNCDAISREHIVTKGMYPDQTIFVSGLPWCLNEPKEISMVNFTKKILCRTHNSMLSDVDDAGIDAINKFREEVILNKARSAMAPRRWTVVRIQFDGRGLERWFLKTFININAEGEWKIGRDATEIGRPSEHLVRIAFGMEQFKPRAGLYGLAQVGENWKLNDGVQSMMLANKEIVLGCLFRLHGYRFILYLGEEGLGTRISVPVLDDQERHDADSLYPLKQIRCNIGNHLSHIMDFRY
jgi:hypothetical protein